LSGLCSCLFDGRGELTDDVEQCFRAEPIKITSYNCVSCTTPLTTEELEDDRWMAKVDQKTKKQTDICSCRQINDHCETMYHFAF